MCVGFLRRRHNIKIVTPEVVALAYIPHTTRKPRGQHSYVLNLIMARVHPSVRKHCVMPTGNWPVSSGNHRHYSLSSILPFSHLLASITNHSFNCEIAVVWNVQLLLLNRFRMFVFCFRKLFVSTISLLLFDLRRKYC